MNPSRRDLLTAGAAALIAPLPARRASAAPQTKPAAAVARPATHPPNLPIRDYLVREARHITDGALSDLTSAADFTRQITERRRQFMAMLGLADLPPAGRRDPVPFKVTGVVDRPAYRIEKLHYESLSNLHVTANLYVPKTANPSARRPPTTDY